MKASHCCVPSGRLFAPVEGIVPFRAGVYTIEAGLRNGRPLQGRETGVPSPPPCAPLSLTGRRSCGKITEDSHVGTRGRPLVFEERCDRFPCQARKGSIQEPNGARHFRGGRSMSAVIEKKPSGLPGRRHRPRRLGAPGNRHRRERDAGPDGHPRGIQGKGRQPLKGARISGSLHMTIQTAVLIEIPRRPRRRGPLGLVQYLLDPGPCGGGDRRPTGIPVFAWKGETLEEYWWCTEQALTWPDGEWPKHDPRRRRRCHHAGSQRH